MKINKQPEKQRKLLMCFIGGAIFILTGFFIIQPNNSIVATWISKNDSNSKWVFTPQSKLKTYYENELIDKYEYHVSDTSPQCGVDVENILQLHPDIKFLKLISLDSDKKSCYYIYGLTEKKLTLQPFKKGGLMIFKKE